MTRVRHALAPGARTALLLAVLAFAPGVSRAQVSPGPLAAPHASIDGATQCFQCHAPGAPRSGRSRNPQKRFRLSLSLNARYPRRPRRLMTTSLP